MTADRSQLFRDRIEDTHLCLITLSHVSIEPPIRVAVNNENVVSNGETFIAGQMNVVLPKRGEGRTSAQITIANVDRRIGLAAQRLITPADVTFQVVDAAEPDTIDIDYPPMRLTGITGNALAVSGELTSRFNLQEPYPKVRATKTVAPGLYY